MSAQEVQRQMLLLLGSVCGFASGELPTLKLVDVGCGVGGHLLDFLRAGFAPENLTGIELIAERMVLARSRVPSSLRMIEGDASSTPIAPQSQDIVFQSVVFSSLLNEDFQQELANRMWSWLRPGGGVLWYDFTYDNPRNPDVRGVPLRRVRQLFPAADPVVRRVTLAPPLSRRICRIHPAAYHALNCIPGYAHTFCVGLRKGGSCDAA